jgi:hypothetical protein
MEIAAAPTLFRFHRNIRINQLYAKGALGVVGDALFSADPGAISLVEHHLVWSTSAVGLR